MRLRPRWPRCDRPGVHRPPLPARGGRPGCLDRLPGWPRRHCGGDAVRHGGRAACAPAIRHRPPIRGPVRRRRPWPGPVRPVPGWRATVAVPACWCGWRCPGRRCGAACHCFPWPGRPASSTGQALPRWRPGQARASARRHCGAAWVAACAWGYGRASGRWPACCGAAAALCAHRCSRSPHRPGRRGPAGGPTGQGGAGGRQGRHPPLRRSCGCGPPGPRHHPAQAVAEWSA